jgi:hypothetical protein
MYEGNPSSKRKEFFHVIREREHERGRRGASYTGLIFRALEFRNWWLPPARTAPRRSGEAL